MNNTNTTLNYYNANSNDFFESTVNADVGNIRNRFLKYVPEGSHILDLGCGSGRDTKAFLKLGYNCEAIDASLKLCKLASNYAGTDVRCMEFLELDEIDKYDAIWACASLLHSPSLELREIFGRLHRALRTSGVIYVSFKHGDFEGERGGRYYTDMTSDRLAAILSQINGLRLIEEWYSEDVRPDTVQEWYNAIILKEN